MLRSSLAISNQGRFFANRLEYKSREFLNRLFVTLFAYVLFYYSTCVISSFIFPCTFLLVACDRKIVFCMSSANIFFRFTTLFRNWLECGRRLFYAFRYRVFANISFIFDSKCKNNGGKIFTFDNKPQLLHIVTLIHNPFLLYLFLQNVKSSYLHKYVHEILRNEGHYWESVDSKITFFGIWFKIWNLCEDWSKSKGYEWNRSCKLYSC